MQETIPFRTADLPAVPCVVGARPEDFVVAEIPAYEPSGEGTHVHFTIEKTGIPTMQAVREIAKGLGIPPHGIGSAGLKDARAVTRQRLSVEHVAPERILALDLPRIRVLDAARHGNKLKIGHLAGNRFRIRLRETPDGSLDTARAVLDRLAERGCPNDYGPQRFGSGGRTPRIGRALLAGDFAEAAAWIAGRPGPEDRGPVRKARERFDAGRYGEAARAWPYPFRECVRLCREMARRKGDARRAVHALGRRMLSFYVSAYQGRLFNEVVAARIDSIDRLLPGDLAWKHDNGAVFPVEDAAAEQPRADRFEVSPTGPLFGGRMTAPAGEPATIEAGVLTEAGLTIASFPSRGPFRCAGGRRPLRFRPDEIATETGTDENGPYLELRFTLPSGSYATVLLREIGKEALRFARDEIGL